MNNELTSISPIDGRYHSKTKFLSKYFSESALMKYRLNVEIEYLWALRKVKPDLEHLNWQSILKILRDFDEGTASKIKEIEKTTNHDVKAIEYFLRSELQDMGVDSSLLEFVHFGLTSQDVNNVAIPASILDWYTEEYIPKIDSLITTLKNLAGDCEGQPMLARTHGQAASPTRLDKEILVFVERLENQVGKDIKFWGKFGGATGNFNAHHVAYPDFDWKKFADEFVSNFGLVRQQTTTQIEHYDGLSELFHNLIRINTILIDFCRDIWQYISMDYFKQKVKGGEVGSSAMPHKVNPIDFENAEGNLGIANAIFDHLALKLPVSRLQRDLTDSTVLRNIGVPIAHTHIAFESITKGISKLILNPDKINEDLDKNWIVLAEAIQTILRREGFSNSYDTLKTLTRGREVNKETLYQFIETLPIDESTKLDLFKLSPQTYTGI